MLYQYPILQARQLQAKQNFIKAMDRSYRFRLAAILVSDNRPGQTYPN